MSVAAIVCFGIMPVDSIIAGETALQVMPCCASRLAKFLIIAVSAPLLCNVSPVAEALRTSQHSDRRWPRCRCAR